MPNCNCLLEGLLCVNYTQVHHQHIICISGFTPLTTFKEVTTQTVCRDLLQHNIHACFQLLSKAESLQGTLLELLEFTPMLIITQFEFNVSAEAVRETESVYVCVRKSE